MTNNTWRILLHTTDGHLITYTLSPWDWQGSARRGHGITLMSTCRPDELPSVLDSVADLVLQSHPFQAELPFD